jgi:hypothetical protein
MIVLHIVRISPGGAHAVPVLKGGTERAVTAGKGGMTPGIGHEQPLVQQAARPVEKTSGRPEIGFLYGKSVYQGGCLLSRRHLPH